MANKKIKHIVAKLLGETTEETLDIYDESALHATDIVDNLTSNDATKVLSAKQGKALNDSLANISNYLNVKGFSITYNGATFDFRSTGRILACNVISSAMISLPTTWTTIGAYQFSNTFGFLTMPTVNNQTVSLRYNNGNVQLLCTTPSAIYVQGSGATMLYG